MQKNYLFVIGAGAIFLTGIAVYLVSRSQTKQAKEDPPKIVEGQQALTRSTVRAWMDKTLPDPEAELVSLETLGEEKQGVISVWAKIRQKSPSGEPTLSSYPMEIEWRTKTVLAWDFIQSSDPE